LKRAPKKAAAAKRPAPKPVLRVLHVTPEAAPFARTGGLGDVAGALASAQARGGGDIALLMPLYRGTDPGALTPVVEIGGAQVLRRDEPWASVRIYFVRHDASFAREGLYGTASGDYADNAARFAWLCEAAVALALREPFDILHLHDWQAALVPVLLAARAGLRERMPSTRTLLSIHNLAYQGIAPKSLLEDLALPPALGDPTLLGQGDVINLLLGGLRCADGLATVSRRYVREMQTPQHGRGLHAVLRERKKDLRGILNGIDTDAWDPARDPVLHAPYSARDPRGKAACRRALCRELGLAGNDEEPIVGFVGRLVEQKGIDLLLAVLPDVAARSRVVLVGNGDAGHERAVAEAARASSGRVAARIGFLDASARRALAGSDLVLVPSRYEPCGLVQMYAMRHGALPVAHKTGGLAETILDGKTGFLFARHDKKDLLRALDRALRALADPKRRLTMIRAAMSRDFSWDKSVAAYQRLYRTLLASPARSVAIPEEQGRAPFAAATDGRALPAQGPSRTRPPEAALAVLPGRAEGARVALLAQGPRRLYSYWQADADVAPAAPRVECRETGMVAPVAGRLPAGDGWIAAEPERHYRVLLGTMVTAWVRTPPEAAAPRTGSADLWSVHNQPSVPASRPR
jgi:starch synthase